MDPHTDPDQPPIPLKPTGAPPPPRGGAAYAAGQVPPCVAYGLQLPPRRSGGTRIGCILGLLACLLVAALICGLGVLAVGIADAAREVASSGGGLGNAGPSRINEEVIEGAGLPTANKVAVVDVKGIISMGSSLDIAGSRRIIDELAQARRDPHVVAVILDMNTPGGEVIASDEIHREVRRCSEAGKPVVTCMHSLGASGGYFIAAGGDYIIANRMTLTGSIGVIMASVNYHQLLGKIGVESEVYASGEMKDMLAGGRPRTEKEITYVRSMVDAMFLEFARIVADGRERYETPEDVVNSEFGDGRILTGTEALRLGLVDELGYFDDAVARAKELADVPQAKVVRFRRTLRLSEILFSMKASRELNLRTALPAEIREIHPGTAYYLMPSVLP